MLACQDRQIRVLNGNQILFQAPTQAAPSCISYILASHDPQNRYPDAKELLYGTDSGESASQMFVLCVLMCSRAQHLLGYGMASGICVALCEFLAQHCPQGHSLQVEHVCPSFRSSVCHSSTANRVDVLFLQAFCPQVYTSKLKDDCRAFSEIQLVAVQTYDSQGPR